MRAPKSGFAHEAWEKVVKTPYLIYLFLVMLDIF